MPRLQPNKQERPLEGKVCVIVGGTGNIGGAISSGLFEAGATVVLTSRSKESAVEFAVRLDKTGRRVLGVKADIARDKDIDNLVAQVIRKFGRIDVLVCCAGFFGPFGRFESVSFSDNLEPIRTNLVGSMRCVHVVIPYMKRRKSGRIILFSGGGIGGDRPLVNATSYFTSKGAVAVFVEVLAEELRGYNIKINAILPGQILTGSTKKTLRISSKRLGPVLSQATRTLKETGGGSTEPVVNTVSFLASEESSHITGKLISCKWDSLDTLSKRVPPEGYTLRRIEGRKYRKVG